MHPTRRTDDVRASDIGVGGDISRRQQTAPRRPRSPSSGRILTILFEGHRVIPFLPESVLASTILIILIVLSLAGLWQPDMHSSTRRLITLGLSLLVLSAAMHILSYASPQSRHLFDNLGPLRPFLQDLLVLVGFPLVAIGLVQLGWRMRGCEQMSRLQRRLGEVTNQLQSTNGVLDSMLRSSLSGVALLKTVREHGREIVDFEFRLVNEAGEQILGRSANHLVGRRLLQHCPSLQTHAVFQSLACVVEARLPIVEQHCFLENDDVRWFQIAAVRHGDGVAATFVDITEQKTIEEQLRHAALHDALTGLPNRAYFLKRLEQTIHRSRMQSGHLFAVLFIDFDRFKMINDSLGHNVGDQLLINVAERLRLTLRGLDIGGRCGERQFSARLGGDEFVVLLDELREPGSAVLIAERLLKELAAPHQIDGQKVVSTASIGIVSSNRNYERAEDVIRDADTAMYQAKNAGRDQHVVFQREMHTDAVAQMQLENDLRVAVNRREFQLEYQPIVALDTGRIAGFEALIRWPHPTRGMIHPCEFIILAEELGLIIPIGQWVIETACAALSDWQKRFPSDAPLSINVNLSRLEIVSHDLVDRVRESLDQSGIPPETLHLEITETMCMGNLEEVTPIIRDLKALGVKIAMDDFGTGHSSLSCLDALPFDILKIDQSFVRSTRKKRDFAAILRSMIELGQNLNMPVVVEGVETEDQRSLLQALDCTYAQGWLFSAPISAECVEELLARESEPAYRRAA